MLTNMSSADINSSGIYIQCAQFISQYEISLQKNTSHKNGYVQDIAPSQFNWANKMLGNSMNKLSNAIIYVMMHFKCSHTSVSTHIFQCSSPLSDNVFQGQKLPRGKTSLDMKSLGTIHPTHTALFSRSTLNILSHLIIYSMRE